MYMGQLDLYGSITLYTIIAMTSELKNVIVSNSLINGHLWEGGGFILVGQCRLLSFSIGYSL